MIRDCLAKGEARSVDVNGRLVRSLPIGKRVLVVIYIEIRGGALVVTAYWRD